MAVSFSRYGVVACSAHYFVPRTFMPYQIVSWDRKTKPLNLDINTDLLICIAFIMCEKRFIYPLVRDMETI
jgi:hypothetical protein